MPVKADYSDRYVSTLGTDIGFGGKPNNCLSSINPCRTIQNAIDRSVNGDTIKVAQGQYTENIEVEKTISDFSILGGWSDNFLTRSDNPSLTIINGANSSSVFRMHANSIDIDIKIECFTIENGLTSGYGGGISISSYNSGNTTAKLSNNIIAGNGAHWGGGISATSSPGGTTTVTLINNMIVNNEGDAGGGIYANSNSSSTTITVLSSTITDNNSSLRCGGLFAYSLTSDPNLANTTANVTNTIIWGNTSTLPGEDIYISEWDNAADSTSTVNTSYSDIGDIYYSTGTYNDNNGNINENPLFVSPASGNYHLRGASPAINIGICGKLLSGRVSRIAPYEDFEGDSRPDPGDLHCDTVLCLKGNYLGCDMGADEYPEKDFPWEIFIPAIIKTR